ncbi:uncharacterized protein LOC143378974 [Andrena cerasifolii]|uniref:uncharacterized protein LOC143378974 n=1 Tax=Andrena cerasifolii TaxID=2819439 RepID=UPI004037C05A
MLVGCEGGLSVSHKMELCWNLVEVIECFLVDEPKAGEHGKREMLAEGLIKNGRRGKSGEQDEGLMLNEGTSSTLQNLGAVVLLPEVTYPWTVSCLEYGIASVQDFKISGEFQGLVVFLPLSGICSFL